MLVTYRVEWYPMVMTREERVARINQIRDQITSLNEELQRLANEDDQYGAYMDRARAGGKNALAYADFARVASAWEKLEASWVHADRPSTWGQLPLLNRLRDVLIVAGSPEPDSSPLPTPEPDPFVERAMPVSANTSSTGPPVAVGVRPVVGSGTSVGSRVPATANVATNRPLPGGPVAIPIPPPDPPAADNPNTPPVQVVASKGSTKPPVAQRHVSREQLIEMHIPIVKELGEIVKRAEDELRTAQYANGLTTLDWTTYLLERVASPSPPLIARLTKALDEVLRGGAILQDADRARLEELRTRIGHLANES